MKKIYMAGAGGMLGEAFYNIFKEQYEIKCSDIDLNSSWLEYLDFRDFEAYKKAVYNFKPDYIFHLGAHTSLEYCEQNSDDAYLTNTISAENATYLANSLDIPILYISTAGIFDGSQDTYDDWSIPNPLGVYARSKYMGELFVKENAYRYLICRAGWMMGGGHKKDKKFVNKLLTQLNNGKKELFVVDDKMGTPTYTFDFAKNVDASSSWGSVGTESMTQSAGVFTFPSTGIYEVTCKVSGSRSGGTNKYCVWRVYMSTDSGGSYLLRSQGTQGMTSYGGTNTINIFTPTIISSPESILACFFIADFSDFIPV